MFGHSYFGGRYFGGAYWGSGSNTAPPAPDCPTTAQIWSYMLSNGLTTEQNVVGIYAMLTALTGGAYVLPVNVKQVNDKIIYGNGIPVSDVFRVTP